LKRYGTDVIVIADGSSFKNVRLSSVQYMLRLS
jgi:hypothetical protein